MRARKREPGGLDVQGLGAALGRIQPRAMPADTADGPERRPERRPDWPDWTSMVFHALSVGAEGL